MLASARQLADASGRSMGAVVSELARRGLGAGSGPVATRNGIVLLPVVPSDPVVTLDEVNRLRDELPRPASCST